MWRRIPVVSYNSPMRLVGRIFLVLGVATVPPVVVLIGCSDNISHLPGLPNELPNAPGTPVSPSGTTSSSGTGAGTTTSGTTTTISTGGTALTLCDCAAAVLAGSATCLKCEAQNCVSTYDLCQAGDCATATSCANGCADDGGCLATCIDTYPDYAAFLGCLLNNGCNGSCGVSPEIANCPVNDAGADG